MVNRRRLANERASLFEQKGKTLAFANPLATMRYDKIHHTIATTSTGRNDAVSQLNVDSLTAFEDKRCRHGFVYYSCAF